MKKVQLTRHGLENMQKEYEELLKIRKPKAVTRLQTARSMGDLSENSEYSAAKEELAFVEGRIQEIEELLKNVEVVDNHSNGHIVSLGSTIRVEVNGEKEELQIVGEFEADPLNKKLSSISPIGKALLNRKINEVVEVEVPAGKTKYKILEIK
ncbi:transcription elongation factor GreA [Candidatus Roizmanbacteria bacterium RIFCSPHIGHO2_01_FULL_39_8]|uniref:Transcription elongation factor GreA n=3 Tax=Candidatus Roizmaniibacteriota TaxID=1752723 RepID=A0A1F7GHQ0_9BACT|nr:MAG: transcription elongation factor GreA [Candidatus Roizmanbacteria bacterium RIFCSPHIGHO2_01_FULL_39_8]OGK27617.1 MAG: transcription elongation factor GreA [Candidatus Roizmanbacteria bacterium RIFCSPHIGHO2_02_FULL_39_9]OGK35313.1 MAG: transcription elongation factor GreA [Candidatus Roizmanbacteria bacterium RIFCSPHIGHO2_12_FULL_39_8]